MQQGSMAAIKTTAILFDPVFISMYAIPWLQGYCPTSELWKTHENPLISFVNVFTPMQPSQIL